MKTISSLGLLVAVLVAVTLIGAGASSAQGPPATQCAPAAGFPAATTPVAYWSTEARCAIVPPTAGPENFGNKFPGEAAVYMGIVHVAIYDATVAVEGGYRPFLPTPRAPAHTSPAAAIAAAAHDTLVGLQPALGLNAGQQAILDGDYAAYLAAIPDGTAKTNGLAVGQQVAAAVIAWRANDGRDHNPTVADLDPPAPGPGVWQPDPTRPVLGLRLPGIRPLALTAASQFRPDGPLALTSQKYADDLNQVEQLGAIDSSTPDARTDRAGAVLDRPRPPDVERRPAPPRRPPRSRPRPDRADAGDRARRRRRRHDRLLRRQVPLLVLAPLPGDPRSRHRRQPQHHRRPHLAAAGDDAELSRSTPRRTPATAPPSSPPSMPSSAPTRFR